MASGRPSPKRRGRMPLQRDTRAAILAAAAREFGKNGQEGARTQAIAKSAGVNIALLFYYFKNKKQIYNAVLGEVFQRWTEAVTPAMTEPESAQKALLAYASATFDFISQDPARARFVQLEFLRGPGAELRALVKQYLLPFHQQFVRVIQAGVENGELLPVDPQQLTTTIKGLVISHFNNSSVIEMLTGQDPLAPAALARQRRSVLEMIERVAFIKRPGNSKPRKEHA